MKINLKQVKIIRWTARIIGLPILLLGLAFYFGYGNPLPFINPEYTWIENIWLLLFPFIFIGLVVAWKCPKIGGFLIIIPIVLAVIAGIILHAHFPINMLVVLIPGTLFLVEGYFKKS